MIAETRDLRVTFGTTRALDGVSLSLAEGARLGLVGESGSGKSTFGLALMGLLPPAARVEGEMRLAGAPIPHGDDRAMSRLRGRVVGFVHQDPMSAFSPVHTIGAHLARAIRHAAPHLDRRAARDRAAALLAEVEIAEPGRRLGQYPHELSGGMRQRVMIAAALAGEPALVIADEPTTALDATTQAAVIALLDRVLGARGAALILVSHDLGLVARAAREVAVLYGGRLMHRAAVAGLGPGAVHPYTRALIAARPGGTPRGGRLPVIPAPDGPTGPGCPFAPRCAHARARCRTDRPEPRAWGGEGIACHYPLEAPDA